MEVLDTLRSLRQTYDSLRMVFTGSIGLHNVLTSLKRAGYKNAPTNDMQKEDVPPLSDADAQDLARRLLEGESIQTDDLIITAEAIATAADCIPYFIHHIVDDMVQQDNPVDSISANRIVNTYLNDPQDRWDLRHYRDRINNYYLSDEVPLALNLLDILAVAPAPLSFNDLYNQLLSSLANANIEKVRDVLTLIQRDHYIIQQPDGTFCFRYQLIQRYWRQHRGLV
jgi:hypothetical protein